MSRKIFAAAFAFVFGFTFTLAAAEANAQTPRKHTDAEYKAAFAYCDAANLAASQRNMLRMMLDNLERNNPAMKELRPVMERVFSRYLNYEVVKYDYADIFLDEFTVDELKELTRISQSPTMKKYFSKQQRLMEAGSEIARKHLAPHQEEIRAEIKAFALRKAAEKAAAEAKKAQQGSGTAPAAK